MKKRMKQGAVAGVIVLVLGGFSMLLINNYVEEIGAKYIVEAGSAPQADAIVILGAFVTSNGAVSTMLHDRLIMGYKLYEARKAPKIIVSGDHGRKEYDEVNAMKSFLTKKGVAAQDVFMDHAGFSTYESMYRARDVFETQKVIIVTQKYHLKRAVFIARALGLNAYGVASDIHDYGAVMVRNNIREILARNKDFLWTKIIKPRPTYLGDVIPVSGDGRITDDKR